MTRIKHLVIITLAILALGACATCPIGRTPPSNLDTLADYMTGFFSSLAQSQDDPQYYDIHLHMVRIWPKQKNSYWIYVEQAIAGQDPYRQRIYNVTDAAPGVYASKVYELPNPDEFIGAWTEPARFNSLTPARLIDRTGCSIYLVRDNDGFFRGSTRDRDCLSELNGATFATSQVRISAEQMKSWDRGYDADGNQVWGAYKGGYVFDKLENFSIEN